jgi:hypothetical protein
MSWGDDEVLLKRCAARAEVAKRRHRDTLKAEQRIDEVKAAGRALSRVNVQRSTCANSSLLCDQSLHFIEGLTSWESGPLACSLRVALPM